jgi:hypothetical protein
MADQVTQYRRQKYRVREMAISQIFLMHGKQYLIFDPNIFAACGENA